MALITKKNIKNAINANRWPNPFNIKEGDLKGKLKDLPIEIANLAIAYGKLLHHEEFDLEQLNICELSGAFSWVKTDEGLYFWRQIEDGDYDVFYKEYNPMKLEEKLKELKDKL